MEEPREPRFPRGVYARIDQIEDDEDKGGTLLLDCMDIRWVDEQSDSSQPIASREGDGDGIDQALYILTIALKEFRYLTGEFSSTLWYRIELGSPQHGKFVAQQYGALFSDSNERGLISIKRVNSTLQEKLDYLTGWGNAQPSDNNDIYEALRLSSFIDTVAIYDVGQGAATALLSHGIPQMYFDFGGSVIGNRRSFPKHLTRFCFTSNPTIVLSHWDWDWDWDHWSSAFRDRRALNATWILPLQKKCGPLGGVHARFLGLLLQHGKVLWWNTQRNMKLSGVGRSPIVNLFKATGPQTDRNQSGLGLTLDDGKNNKFVLLTGDASYSHCPRIKTNRLIAYFMVPHHGGKTGLLKLPNSRRNRKDHVIYSYGVGNSYLHPRPDTVKAMRKGFTKNTHTALRNKSGFGHVGIELTVGAGKIKKLPCGGYCKLEIQQWV